MKQLITVISISLCVSCGQQSVSLKNEEAKIIECWQDWPTKAKNGEPTYYFADNAILIGQEVPQMKGKAEMNKFYLTTSKISSLKVDWGEKPNIIGFSKDGEVAYSLDKQELSMADSTGAIKTTTSQAVHIWEKDKNGNWRVVLLMIYPLK